MLEQDIRETYRRMADTDMPLSHINIPAAGRVGRARRRTIRAGLIAAPAFAAAAVLVIALATAPTSGLTPRMRPGHESGPVASGGTVLARPVHNFNPLVSSATLNRAPAGWQVTGGSYGNSAVLQEQTPSGTLFNWTAYALGTCNLSGTTSKCQGLPMRLTGPAPAVAGHPAYWGYVPARPGLQVTNGQRHPVRLPAADDPVTLILAYKYAPDSWATVQFMGRANGSDALAMARNVTLHRKAHLPFAAQLTGMPRGQVTASSFVAAKAGLLGSNFTADYSWGSLEVDAEPPRLERNEIGSCSSMSGWISQLSSSGKAVKTIREQPVLKVINGHQVYAATDRNYGFAELCTAADGLMVDLTLQFRPGMSPPSLADVFAHHLRLFGPDPARWTTKPLR